MGYHLAGFDVTGVDINPQPRFPFRFVRADVFDFMASGGAEGFDVVTASPPCQAFSALKHLAKRDHPNLIPQTRALLRGTGRPYVIENVVGAPLESPVMLCGTMFGLRTDCGAELRRHRLFETDWPVLRGLKCRHHKRRSRSGVYGDHPRPGDEFDQRGRDRRVIGDADHTPMDWSSRVTRDADHSAEDRRVISIHGDDHAPCRRGQVIGVYGNKPRATIDSLETQERKTITVTGNTPQQNVERNVLRQTFSVEAARKAMGIDWMVMKELSQAIPPAYTYYLGLQLRRFLR